jgi:hypothetical protein
VIPQLTASLTSAPILVSPAAVSSSSAKAVDTGMESGYSRDIHVEFPHGLQRCVNHNLLLGTGVSWIHFKHIPYVRS